ncbi:MAG TPA: 23S rRNA (uracil(1939)-C(5))-methyltransferase RlmD, partial [Anseongella sp.]|nr:23S rRNA (uracil(1939)-C(5))-methyltransferase RlmD [Anseongella sp.]
MAIRRLKQPEQVEELEIIDITEDGRGIGRSAGRVVFVDKAIPGDIASVELFRRKKTLFEGRISRLVQASAHRVDPFCEHFGTCGGCKWQHLDYPAQLVYKQKQVSDALERLAGVDAAHISPIIPSPETSWYRNKLEFTFSNRRWLSPDDFALKDKGELSDLNALGFHVPGRFDKIINIDTCYLQQDVSNRIRNAVREYARENCLSFYDLGEHSGFLRNLIIRTASTGELMVILVFAEDQQEATGRLMDFIKESFPQVTSLLYIVNRKLNDTIFDQEVRCWHGRDHIFEEMAAAGGTVRFKIGPKSFYQTNSQQALRLYRVAADFAGLKGREKVYDLYTGAGTIANFIARQAGSVTGIEYVEAAVRDARENSALNNIENTSFFAGDMKDVLTDEFVLANGRPDVIITDPP